MVNGKIPKPRLPIVISSEPASREISRLPIRDSNLVETRVHHWRRKVFIHLKNYFFARDPSARRLAQDDNSQSLLATDLTGLGHRPNRVRSAIFAFLLSLGIAAGQDFDYDTQIEESYYPIVTLPIPDHIKLEASGLATMPDGKIAIATRKGEVWILENPEVVSEKPKDYSWKRFATGLHEPLGLTWHEGSLYTSQRSEVTRLEDRDGDGQADAYLTAAKGWGVSGNYHEYAYGPVFDSKGDMWITLNINLGEGQELLPSTPGDVLWRGWAMRQKPGGPLLPVACGLRSPIGLGTNHLGDVFSTDQQGNWWATCSLIHLREGAFFGHADSLRDAGHELSPVKHPGKLPKDITTAEAIEKVPGYAPPAVWFPYTKIGMSTTGLLCDQTKGSFGPFTNQLFVGEFTESFVSRVFLEKVEGQYQGACFHFRKGLQCAALNMTFSKDGKSMFVGESNRGWNSLGTRSFGLEKITWSGRVPFEIKTMEATSSGFRLIFTKKLMRNTAENLFSYQMKSYTHNYWSKYGSDEVDEQEVQITAVKVADDNRSVELICEGLRSGYIHELDASGVWAEDRTALLHAEAYYTLNRIPK